jgi:hypothetical protein
MKPCFEISTLPPFHPFHFKNVIGVIFICDYKYSVPFITINSQLRRKLSLFYLNKEKSFLSPPLSLCLPPIVEKFQLVCLFLSSPPPPLLSSGYINAHTQLCHTDGKWLLYF